MHASLAAWYKALRKIAYDAHRIELIAPMDCYADVWLNQTPQEAFEEEVNAFDE